MNEQTNERMNEWIHNKKDNGNKVLKKLYFPEDFLYAKNDYIYRKFLYTIRTRIESPLELNPHRKIKILIESSLE